MAVDGQNINSKWEANNVISYNRSSLANRQANGQLTIDITGIEIVMFVCVCVCVRCDAICVYTSAPAR